VQAAGALDPTSLLVDGGTPLLHRIASYHLVTTPVPFDMEMDVSGSTKISSYLQ
jgi:hypothetical protein